MTSQPIWGFLLPSGFLEPQHIPDKGERLRQKGTVRIWAGPQGPPSKKLPSALLALWLSVPCLLGWIHGPGLLPCQPVPSQGGGGQALTTSQPTLVKIWALGDAERAF